MSKKKADAAPHLEVPPPAPLADVRKPGEVDIFREDYGVTALGRRKVLRRAHRRVSVS